MSAIERGVNYFDTAYLYPGSESTLGEVLRRNPDAREKINIATKLPHGSCKTYADFDRILNLQLARLGTDYIDYYLIHNLTSVALPLIHGRYCPAKLGSIISPTINPVAGTTAGRYHPSISPNNSLSFGRKEYVGSSLYRYI
jgi:hypothetical protein